MTEADKLRVEAIRASMFSPSENMPDHEHALLLRLLRLLDERTAERDAVQTQYQRQYQRDSIEMSGLYERIGHLEGERDAAMAALREIESESIDYKAVAIARKILAAHSAATKPEAKAK